MTASVLERKLLTIRETATLLRQSERSIRRKIHSGELLAVRLGEHGPLRIDERELERFLEPPAVDVSDDGSRQGQLRPAQAPSERRGTQTIRGQSSPPAHTGQEQ
jgi:excisionase family DNA binding protein